MDLRPDIVIIMTDEERAVPPYEAPEVLAWRNRTLKGRKWFEENGGGIPLVGVGGIATAEDAWARIRAGASLVQLYSAMIYEGPGIARRIVRGLEELMRRDGFASVAEAVGSE